MEICVQCGRAFEEWEAESDFDNGADASIAVSYSQLHRCLCGKCAIEAYANGDYLETCECCGKEFYPEDEISDFKRQVSHKVADANMYEHGILCADCAAEKLLDELEDDEAHDGCSVYEAALAWLSHGKDEDYMFGYSEDALEATL